MGFLLFLLGLSFGFIMGCCFMGIMTLVSRFSSSKSKIFSVLVLFLGLAIIASLIVLMLIILPMAISEHYGLEYYEYFVEVYGRRGSGGPQLVGVYKILGYCAGFVLSVPVLSLGYSLLFKEAETKGSGIENSREHIEYRLDLETGVLTHIRNKGKSKWRQITQFEKEVFLKNQQYWDGLKQKAAKKP